MVSYSLICTTVVLKRFLEILETHTIFQQYIVLSDLFFFIFATWVKPWELVCGSTRQNVLEFVMVIVTFIIFLYTFFVSLFILFWGFCFFFFYGRTICTNTLFSRMKNFYVKNWLIVTIRGSMLWFILLSLSRIITIIMNIMMYQTIGTKMLLYFFMWLYFTWRPFKNCRVLLC